MLRDRFPADPLSMFIPDLNGITFDPELVEIDRILADGGALQPLAYSDLLRKRTPEPAFRTSQPLSQPPL